MQFSCMCLIMKHRQGFVWPYVLVTESYWYHMSVVLSPGVSFLWQLWYLQGLSYTWITITNRCLRRLQGVQQYSTVSYLSTWEVGTDCWHCCQCFKGYDIGGGSLRSVKPCINRAIKGSVSPDWISLSFKPPKIWRWNCEVSHKNLNSLVVPAEEWITGWSN